MSDQLKAILDSVPGSNRMRAAAWDAFYNAPDADQAGRLMDRLGVPPDARMRIVELKAREAVPTGASAASRFASNAADVLNPVEAVKGVYSAVRHPVQTATNVLGAQSAQFDKARERFGEGRYLEAAGHGMASALPLLGPVAAEAGEQIGTGDVAGGLGKATGLLAPFAAAPVVRGAARVAKGAPERAAGALEAGATERIADVMSPKVGRNKQRFGNQAEEVAPQIAKDLASGGAPWTREGLHEIVRGKLSEAEAALDAASDARLANLPYKTKPLIDGLLEKRRELTAESYRDPMKAAQGEPAAVGRDVVPGPNANRVAQIDQAIRELEALGPVTTYEAVRRVRQAYDGPAKVVYSPSMTADYLTARGGALGASDVTAVLRERLADIDPKTAAANAEYHIYRTANDVMEATREIERTRPRVGRAIMARLTGAVVGGQQAGTAGAVTGYLLGPVVDSALAAGGTTKLKTAKLMTQLAGAIRRGDVQSVDALTAQLTRVRRGTAVQSANEQATSPSGFQSGPAPLSQVP